MCKPRCIFLAFVLLTATSEAVHGNTIASSQPTTAPSTQGAFGSDSDFSSTDPFTITPPSKGNATANDSPELLLFTDMPVVVAAAMRPQSQQEAAASVSVVTANDIQLFNYRSLADVLHGQRSFYLGTDGLNWFAGVRGFQRPGEWNARILVLEDGRPDNEFLYGQSHIDPDFDLPMEALKQVEVIRGPGSALYGTNAVFGVINEVTKDGADVNGAEMKLEGGSLGTIHGNILYGEKFDNGWDVIGDFSAFSSQGDPDIIYDGVTDAAHNDGHIVDSNYEGAFSGFAKAKKGDITLEFNSADREKDNDAATYLTSWFNPGDMYERRTNASIRLDHDFNDDQSLHAMLYYGHYHYQQDFPNDASPPTPAYTYYSSGVDDWIGEQIHYDWQMSKSFHLLTGVDGVQTIDALQHDESSLVGPVLRIPASYNSWALFAQGELKANPWLTLTGGVRLDHIQRIGATVSPRFAAVITPTKKDTIKALYGRAFRDPNLYELLYTSPPPAGEVGNPALNPEIVDTFELVWERQYANNWQSSLNGYLWKMSHSMYEFEYPDGSVQTRNGDTTWAHGVEAEIDKRLPGNGSFRLYASYSRAEEDGAGLTHSPNWIVGSSTAVTICKNTYLSVEPQIVAPMKSDLMVYTHPTFITNIVLTNRDSIKGWTFQTGVYNLFANYARLPRDGAFDQYESTVDYPATEFLVSATRKF